MTRVFCACVAAALFAGVVARAQDDKPQFKSESELVVVHVLVTERSGAYVSGLPSDAFRLFDETRPQTTKFFLNEDAPVTVGLIIDSSGSMGHARDRVIAASTEFVQSSNPQDEIFALTFNDEVHPIFGGNSFTSDSVVLGGALAKAFQPIGRTALYDAVVDGLKYGSHGMHDRRVLVVLSDGGDNASRATLKDVVTNVEASNTVIYTVALADPNDPDSNPKKLKQLADVSGGESYEPGSESEVRSAFQKIARDVRHMYTIGFEPMNSAYHAGFHRLRVEVKTPDGRKLNVKSRSGYLKAHVGP
jgi:Ca-activated chloride channel homolog